MRGGATLGSEPLGQSRERYRNGDEQGWSEEGRIMPWSSSPLSPSPVIHAVVSSHLRSWAHSHPKAFPALLGWKQMQTDRCLLQEL